MSKLIRCGWCSTDPIYQDYHDKEWGVPVYDDQKLFEFIVLEGAQAGLAWITVLKKRKGYGKAFAEFDMEKVAHFSDKQLEKNLLDRDIMDFPDFTRHWLIPKNTPLQT